LWSTLRVQGGNGSDFVFGSNRGGGFTTTSLQKMQELGKNWRKASHLLENRVDIRYIQELLGHQNIRITQVTNPKLKNIKSPS